MPLGLVKEWLGHSSPEITRIYENWSIDRDAERILKALPSVSLPEQVSANSTQAITVEVEAGRDRLAQLADVLPIAKVTELLAMVDTELGTPGGSR